MYQRAVKIKQHFRYQGNDTTEHVTYAIHFHNHKTQQTESTFATLNTRSPNAK
jgi:hypothetical protein